MARKMKSKYRIESECARMRAALNGKYIEHWGEDARTALGSAIESLEWVLLPCPGKKRMKTRAQIEERMDALQMTVAAEPDEDKRRAPYFAMQALGWVLDPLVLPVPTCFTWPARTDGPCRLKAPVRHSDIARTIKKGLSKAC